MNPPIVTVAVLLYGDYPHLAARCLDPLWPLQRAGLIDLRVGMNECSSRTLEYVDGNCRDSDTVDTIRSDANVHKYPMMRRLMELAPPAPHFMWFDDDSYIDHQRPAEFVHRAVALCEPHTMVGQVWIMALGGNQHLWVRHQPWYGGKPVEAGQKVRFCQGAWWVAPTAFMAKHHWPVPELERKGGDVMMGELCRQQGVALRCVRGFGDGFGVRINADKNGRHSRSETRGPMPLPRPVGWDFKPPG